MRVWLVALALAGCGGRTPPPIVDPPPPVEPPVDAPSAEPVAEPEQEAPVTGPPTVAAACRGDRLDLKQLVKTDACVVEAAAAPLPSTIAIELEPKPLRMKAGAQGTATIILTNTGGAEETLLLSEDCGQLVEVAYAMRDSHGERVDLGEGNCGGGRGCPTKTHAFALPPRGELRLDFQLIARIEIFDDVCQRKRTGGPVPKGTYDIDVYSAFPDQRVKVTIY